VSINSINLLKNTGNRENIHPQETLPIHSTLLSTLNLIHSPAELFQNIQATLTYFGKHNLLPCSENSI
jgi:hypothetical protein